MNPPTNPPNPPNPSDWEKDCNEFLKFEERDLRDYFAAQALSGYMAMLGTLNQQASNRGVSLNLSPEVIAKECFDIAGAMLKEREKR